MYTHGVRGAQENKPDLGFSMLSFLAQPIPRSIWPDKPLNFSSSMSLEHIPWVYEIGVTANFNSLNEFRYAFSDVGILLGGLFFGLVLTISQRYFNQARGSPYIATVYLMIFFPYSVIIDSG